MKKYVFYKILRFIVAPIYRLVYRIEVINKENILNNEKVVYAGNHISDLDGITVISTNKKVIHTLAKSELFTKGKSWFFRSMACIKVNRNGNDDQAKKEAIEVLNNGGSVCLFPEGTINKTKDIIMPFKYGAVSFAIKTGAYITPFIINRKFKLFKKGNKIIYGKRYKLNGDIIEENKKLENIIREMLIKEKDNEYI